MHEHDQEVGDMSVLTEFWATQLAPNLLFYQLLIVSGVLWFIHQRLQSSRSAKLINKIPGPWTLPFLGNAHQFINHIPPFKLMKEVVRRAKAFQNEGIIRFWLGTIPFIGLLEPKDIEVILSSHEYLDKSTEYKWFQPWLGDGLLISSGTKWRTHRKLIAPTFHLNVLKSFIPRFNSNAHVLVERLRKEAERGTEFDVHEYMSESTVDVLIETAMGVSNAETAGKGGFKYALAVMKMCDIVHQRVYKPWLRWDSLYKFSNFSKQQEDYLNTIHALSNTVIAKKRELYEKTLKEPKEKQLVEEVADSNADTTGTFLDSKGYIKDDLDDDIGEKKRMAFLELMLETAKGGNISNAEIKEEVDTIMFEGHDTTAAGSSFVLCLLGVYQGVQDKVMEEMNEIFGDSDRDATFNDTLQMKYLERVILETLRMYPPVPLIARKLQREVKLASGYVLPTDCSVGVATYLVHRHPKYWPNPDVFDPDNFLPERMAARHYYAYIPFSAGPRSCVGRKYAMLKLKVLLSTLLRNYRVVSTVEEKDFVLRGDIILKREDGFRIQLVPRRAGKAAA